MAESNNGIDVGYEEVQEIDGTDNLWTDKLESYFVSLMVDEIAKGKMHANTFANAAWQIIAIALKMKTGREYSYLQLKNKYHNLRARWSDFSNLLKEKEIRYNSVTGEVTATDDVWIKLLPRYRRAKTFRKKGLKDYDKLCIIFGDPEIAYRRVDERNKEQMLDGCSEGDGDVSKAKKIAKLRTLESQATTIMGEKSVKKQKSEKTSATDSLDSVGLRDYDKLRIIFGDPKIASNRVDERNKEQMLDGSSEGDGDVSGAKKIAKLDTLEAQATTTIGEKSVKKQKRKKKMSTTASLGSVGNSGDGCGHQCRQVEDDVVRCMEALNSLEDIDGVSYVKATRYIHDDCLWRKMFLCMPDERKKDWVLNI